ncbi:MAG: ACT domain-containing protein [Bacteriovoracaceae bacterium]
MNLIILDKKFAISRLNPDSIIPEWALSSSFLSITRTSNELSVVCEFDLVPKSIKCDSDWKILKIEGVLDFSLTGILASIAQPLAGAQISIFALSTYDTDYILVKQDCLTKACEVLMLNGFKIF